MPHGGLWLRGTGRAGALGPIREIYQWGIGVTAAEGSAEGEDPIPEGFNWDLWVGPSAMRPFKKDVYHPFRWRGWFDFGNGALGDWGAHIIDFVHDFLKLGQQLFFQRCGLPEFNLQT